MKALWLIPVTALASCAAAMPTQAPCVVSDRFKLEVVGGTRTHPKLLLRNDSSEPLWYSIWFGGGLIPYCGDDDSEYRPCDSKAVLNVDGQSFWIERARLAPAARSGSEP